MSDGKFLRGNRLKSVLSRIKTRVGSDIASAISESTLSLTSIINSGDSTTLGSAKGYADGLKIVIDSNISTGDINTLNSAKLYTDEKIQNKFELEDLVNSPVDVGDIIVANDQAGLKGKSSGVKLSNLANASHRHSTSDITDVNSLAAASHTHVEADITDLGSYASSTHTHSSSDLTDGTTTFASKSHTHTESDITDLGSYANASHTHTKSDITDVADLATASNLSNHISDTNNPHSVTYTQVGAAASSHTHVESDITDLGNYSVTGHTHTVSDITDANTVAAAVHSHTLSNITDVTATPTEVNYLSNSTKNIQMQLNDARMYGFFPAWEYEHEYFVGDCIRIPCCKTTQYLECIVAGISGSCPEWPTGQTEIYYTVEDGQVVRHERSIDYKLDEFTSVVNGQCIVDGTSVWLVQDIRDGRPVGAIDLNIWRLRYKNPLTIWYGLSLGDSNIFYSCNADKKNIMSTSEYLKYVRLIKIIISSAIMSIDMGSLRLFDLMAAMGSGSSKYLQHIAGAALVLDWCFRPFDYLKNENLNNIDERVFDNIIMYRNNLLLDNYNSTFEVNLTKSQIITEACACKNKIYNNTLEDDKMYLKNNAIGNRYIRHGLYGQFLDAGLPNITGNFRQSQPGAQSWYGFTDTNGAFSADTDGQDKSSLGGNVSRKTRLLFNAKNSNSIYGNSTTVQPNTITAMYCIKY